MKIADIYSQPGLFERAVDFFWGQWGNNKNYEFYRDAMLN